MRIISKFSDYYDIGLAYGIDDKLRFERETHSVKGHLTTKTPIFITYSKRSKRYRIILFFNLIGFCGKIYPFIKTSLEEISRKDKQNIYRVIDENISYDLDSLNHFIQTHYIPLKEIKSFKSFGYGYGWDPDLYKVLRTFYFEKYEKAMGLFTVYTVPYFVQEQYLFINQYKRVEHTYILTLTPILKSYKFAKVVHPMQAFQEITMYLGSLNSKEDNTVTIDDKYLSQGKGFDCYSFRMIPTKKKIKKC